MENQTKTSALILGASIFLGLCVFAFVSKSAAISIKEYERTVRVKGLAEQEQQATLVIWPIQFSEATNNISTLYANLGKTTEKIKAFLLKHGVEQHEISVAAPNITDKSAQQWGGAARVPFRYTANQAVTVYSSNIARVRDLQSKLSELGKEGIVFSGDSYQSRTEYIYSELNFIKPQMIEEATRKARDVAEKFAQDSNSRLGKIKSASQGQFSIQPRDKNNPHIKKIRVVSTVEYYLVD